MWIEFAYFVSSYILKFLRVTFIKHNTQFLLNKRKIEDRDRQEVYPQIRWPNHSNQKEISQCGLIKYAKHEWM